MTLGIVLLFFVVGFWFGRFFPFPDWRLARENEAVREVLNRFYLQRSGDWTLLEKHKGLLVFERSAGFERTVAFAVPNQPMQVGDVVVLDVTTPTPYSDLKSGRWHLHELVRVKRRSAP